MKKNIVYVERKPSEAVSIEKVFRQVAKNLSSEIYSTAFHQLEYANGTLDTIKNLISFKPKKADVYHITGHVHYIALLLPANKTVLTIHDAGILHIRKGFRRFILKKLLFDFPLKKLKYITVVSEATKREVVHYTKCDEKKLRVIENPLQEQFFDGKEKKFNEKYPTILQIGTAANKNLENLIKAIENIPCKLIIVGRLSDEVSSLLNEKNIDFQNKLNLSNEEIKNEYVQADIVAFCSTFEGFGLPIIEAQATFTTVITSNISPMKEVAGDGAALADPNSFESIRNEILKVINDKLFRDRLIKNGLENIKRFHPKEIAAAYQNLYNEMLADEI